MEPFVRITGAVAPLDRANVDTDQIIPKQFLKRIVRKGYDDALFYGWRQEDPDFILGRPEFRHAPILVAGPNFGSGSSREHAPWALQDWGYRVVIAPSFADIFRSNCGNVGLLCLTLDDGDVRELLDAAPAEATVDLEALEDFVERERASASAGYPYDEDWIRELGSRKYDRCYAPDGWMRQLMAIVDKLERSPKSYPPALWIG